LLDSLLQENKMTDGKVASPEKAAKTVEKTPSSESEKPEKKVRNPVSESEKPEKKVRNPVSESEKTDKKVKSQVKSTSAKNGPKYGKHNKLDDTAVEKEFMAFIAKMKTKYPENGIAYQLNNYPEGLECTFRLARLPAGEGSKFTASFSHPGQNKKKELTEEQKEKLAAKKEKVRERRREAKLRRQQERDSENPEKPLENGDAKKPVVKEEKKEEKVIPKDVKKVEKAVTKEDTKTEKVIA